MTDTPNRPPLWEVMERTSGTVANWDEMIRAVRDWLLPETPDPGEVEFWPDADAEQEWQYRHRLRALLSTEADRAERGE